MFVVLKVILGFIFTYFIIFIITILVTKLFDNYRIKKEKIDYIPKPQQNNIIPIVKNTSNNKKWNSTLGVWEEQ